MAGPPTGRPLLFYGRSMWRDQYARIRSIWVLKSLQFDGSHSLTVVTILATFVSLKGTFCAVLGVALRHGCPALIYTRL
jgi:hypothetical protein